MTKEMMKNVEANGIMNAGDLKENQMSEEHVFAGVKYSKEVNQVDTIKVTNVRFTRITKEDMKLLTAEDKLKYGNYEVGEIKSLVISGVSTEKVKIEGFGEFERTMEDLEFASYKATKNSQVKIFELEYLIEQLGLAGIRCSMGAVFDYAVGKELTVARRVSKKDAVSYVNYTLNKYYAEKALEIPTEL